jgi:hypothetical protein
MLATYLWQQRMLGASLLDEHCQWTWPHGGRAEWVGWAEWADKAEQMQMEYLEYTWWVERVERVERAEQAERPAEGECVSDWVVL